MESNAWLWAFTGLAIPIAVHLLSRKEGKELPFGSIRFLPESSTSRFRTVKLNEIILLLLRCSLIAVLILFLAGFSPQRKDKMKWLILEPGIESASAAQPLVDSLTNHGYQLRFLNHDLSASNDSSSSVNYWALLLRLEQLGPDEAVVITKQRMNNFKGERLSLPRNIKWIQISPDPHEFKAAELMMNQDSLWIRKGITNEQVTQFKTEYKVAHGEKPDSVRINIYGTPEFDHDRMIVLAALGSIQRLVPYPMLITINPPVEKHAADWHFFLGIKPQEDLANVLISEQSEASSILEPAAEKQNHWRITQRLSTDIAIDNGLSVRLAQLISPDMNMNTIDHRVMPDKALWSTKKSAGQVRHTETGNRDSNLLLFVFLFLLISERTVSAFRFQ